MKFGSKTWIGALFIGCMLWGAAQPAAAGELVGVKKCKVCHGKATGDQFAKWSGSAHAQALATLGTQQSMDIAAAMGLGDPQQAAECLRCHSTRGFLGSDVVVIAATDPEPEEPVGCEACHGPGSAYGTKVIMTDPLAAAAAGLIIDRSEEFCTRCHNADSPTFQGFDFAASWEKIAHPVPNGG